MTSKEHAATVELGIPAERLPRHIAIIMDGNGRWAQARGLPRLAGHRAGAEVVRKIIAECSRLGIGCLTLYSFSLDNWKRPAEEVQGLMWLYAQYLASERKTLMDNNVRLAHLGRAEDLPPDVVQELEKSLEASKNNTGMTLCLALNYSGRDEIIRASQRLAQKVSEGKITVEQITPQSFANELDTSGLPDPDLLIRTAGERRISDFLLWQISYAEIFVTDSYWPDFSEELLHTALKDFASRKRRFGGLNKPDA